MNNLQIRQGTNEAWFIYDGNKVLLGSHDRSLIEKVYTILKIQFNMETNVQGLDVSPNDAKRVLPAVSIEEAAEIIQALYEYGQIHTVKGVIYGESHERYLNRAMTWLHFYRLENVNVLAGRCSSCKFWGRTKESECSKDMGKCERLSAPKGADYPDLEKTGIESTPLCSHDGAGSEYETKSWFGCVHYIAR